MLTLVGNRVSTSDAFKLGNKNSFWDVKREPVSLSLVNSLSSGETRG